MGAAPTQPGINDKFSIPERPIFNVYKTNLCQFSPAPTLNVKKSLFSSTFSIPFIWL